MDELPPLASTIFFELWYDDVEDSYEVVTLYNDEPITFGACEESPCQFYTFKQHVVDSVLPGTIDEACKVKGAVEMAMN